MNFMKKNIRGIFICLIIAIPSWLLGKIFPVIGGAVISILVGMIIAMFGMTRERQNQELNGHQR